MVILASRCDFFWFVIFPKFDLLGLGPKILKDVDGVFTPLLAAIRMKMILIVVGGKQEICNGAQLWHLLASSKPLRLLKRTVFTI